MLKEIRIKNFKSLKDTKKIELKPITLLVGPNSSGKSSLIQFLLLLKQTAESRDFGNPIVFNGTCIELESYRNIIYKKRINRKLEFEFSFEKKEGRPFPFLAPNIKYRVILNRKKSSRKVEIKSFDVIDTKRNKTIISIKYNKAKRKYYAISNVKDNKKQQKQLGNDFRFIRFYPYLPFPLAFDEKFFGKYSETLRRARYLETQFSRRVYYLGPLRVYPRRYYPVSGATMEDVGFKGEKTTEVLATNHKVMKKVQRWIKKFGMAKSIKIKPLQRKGTLVEVILEDSKVPISVNIYDVGFGVSQVLPIIVEGFHAPPNSLILIEQPEIHLHPKLQSEMADLLLEISESNKNLVIETHSEHLIMRLQRRVAEGTLKSRDIAIYFFELTKEGTKIRPVTINDLGVFENWPKGFFQEDIEESFKITKAMLKRKNKE